jgi:hypothetical protein
MFNISTFSLNRGRIERSINFLFNIGGGFSWNNKRKESSINFLLNRGGGFSWNKGKTESWECLGGERYLWYKDESERD